jgi:hypothetical protein
MGPYHPYFTFTSGGAVPPTPVDEQTRPRPDDGPHPRIVKPSGLLHKPRKEGRRDVSDRVEDSRAIAAEVAARLAREFGDETAATLAAQQALDVAELSAQQVAFEIGVLLRKKLRTEEEEVLLLLLLAASA